MRALETVSGTISPEMLGATLMHEHVRIDPAQGPYEHKDEERELAGAIAGLEMFKAAGGRTIVDVTPIGMGRDATFLRTVSRAAGINILCATGFYFGSRIPEWVSGSSAEDMAAFFIRELQQGIEGTDIRPAVIGEIGSGRGELSPVEERVFRAAARAHLITGAPILTHTTYGTMALEQLTLLEHAGVNLQRVVLGHCDIFHPLETVLEAARRGAYIGIDTIGKERWRGIDGIIHERPDAIREKLILTLLDAGFEDQLVLSSDLLVNRGEVELNPQTFGKSGYAYVLRDWTARLRAARVPEQAIIKMIKQNPAQVLNS